MILPFYKYHGTGNDFIIIDNRKRQFDSLDVAKLCHRNFGIGADGLMLLQEAEGYDFEMVYYNSDGNISTMCGNGGRCIVAFSGLLGIPTSENVNFLAVDGPHKALFLYENESQSTVELKLADVSNVPANLNTYVLNTGSPHFVKFVDNVDALDLLNEAHAIRYNNDYKTEGININFVEILGNQSIKVRTYERGVENETLSCGTGVTASAIAYIRNQNIESANNNFEVSVQTPGGLLKVSFFYSLLRRHFEQVTLIGPATLVFNGEINI